MHSPRAQSRADLRRPGPVRIQTRSRSCPARSPRAGAHSRRVIWAPPRVAPAGGARRPRPRETFDNSGGWGLH
eukprot:1614991-Pyramimonas_sp.AAC.1